MKKAIIGKKVGMTQIFDEMGKVIPVTVIEAGPCVVTQKMTAEKEGYEAVQLGYEEVSEKHISKPEAGHLKKNGIGMLKHLKEFKLENAAELNVGDVLKADVFAAGDKVDVTGTSKGHGYAGVVKRHGAQRTPTSHGGGPVHRHAGSMGSGTDPSRIFKGKIGAGHMGVDQVTVQNLDVVQVDPELNMLVIRGAIPGPKGGLVYVKSSAKVAPVKKGKGAQFVRSAGVAAQLMAKENGMATVRLPSGEYRKVRLDCFAVIGQVGNIDHSNISIGKAGRKRHMGIRPTVRGSVMNPCDHPHGGGEGKSPVGRPGPVTPWGKPALGYKTRKTKNRTDKFIVKRRNAK